jgi:exosome complex component RRP43
MELSAEALRVLHPREVYSRFIRKGVRPDGRTINSARKTAVNVGTLTACDGSAIVRVGGTTVAVGVSVTLTTTPRGVIAAPPVVVTVQIPPACSSRFRRTAFADPGSVRAAAISDMITKLWINPQVLAASELAVDEMTSFRLEVEAICTTWDGNVDDAAFLAVFSAVASTTLPALRQRVDGSWTTAVLEDATLPSAPEKPSRKIHLGVMPVPLSFACVRLSDDAGSADIPSDPLVIVADPSAEEEDLACGSITVVAGLPIPGRLPVVGTAPTLLVQQIGGPVPVAAILSCITVAQAHAVMSTALLPS